MGVRKEDGAEWDCVRRVVRREMGPGGCWGHWVRECAGQPGVQEGQMQASSLNCSRLCPQGRQGQRQRRDLLRRYNMCVYGVIPTFIFIKYAHINKNAFIYMFEYIYKLYYRNAHQ